MTSEVKEIIYIKIKLIYFFQLNFIYLVNLESQINYLKYF